MKLGRIAAHVTALAVVVAFASVSVATAAGTSGSSSKTGTTTSSTASSANKQTATGGGGSVQGYAAAAALQTGTIVQLAGGASPKVSAASNKNLNQMYGTVVDPHQLSLTISDSSLPNEAYVASTGTYDVLVSTEGGPISTGDFVTLSAIDGVGMKAGTDQPIIFGRAASSFSGKSGLGNVTLKDTTGATSKTVTLGMVSVTINIERNPNKKSTKAEVPKLLQRVGQAVAEKPVGALRIYLSLFITGLSIVIAITVLYSGIRNSIISIGRNPLSKKSIFRGLLEIILTSFLILIIGLFTVYLLLKL